jgi:hypothetical protein
MTALTPAVLTVPPVMPSPVAPHSHAGISPAEAVKMAGWVKEDLTKGKITQAQADQIFGELNTPLGARAPDTRSDEVQTARYSLSPGEGERLSHPVRRARTARPTDDEGVAAIRYQHPHLAL